MLFNNAGGGGNFPNESSEEFSRVINTNLNGTLYMSQAVWPHMVKAAGGAIVNMSSVAATRGTSPKMHEKFDSTSSSYWAAKAGVDAMTRYMAGIGGGVGIRVNGVRPGQIMTPGATRGTITDADGGHHAFEGMFELMQMIDGPGYPIDVANLVLFLVSEESRFITSQIIHVDGGTPVQI
ncbi:MAG: SDR family NAD(P)-dependent oxidoreductase [Chloroflexi bacterium]|nr:SDR family NAD(P)-dependent oxidoreductase [Chloroflexota bacterium]